MALHTHEKLNAVRPCRPGCLILKDTSPELEPAPRGKSHGVTQPSICPVSHPALAPEHVSSRAVAELVGQSHLPLVKHPPATRAPDMQSLIRNNRFEIGVGNRFLGKPVPCAQIPTLHLRSRVKLVDETGFPVERRFQSTRRRGESELIHDIPVRPIQVELKIPIGRRPIRPPRNDRLWKLSVKRGVLPLEQSGDARRQVTVKHGAGRTAVHYAQGVLLLRLPEDAGGQSWAQSAPLKSQTVIRIRSDSVAQIKVADVQGGPDRDGERFAQLESRDRIESGIDQK